MAKLRLVFILIALALWSCTAALANPTLFGNSGLISVPDDTVLKEFEFNLGFHTVDLKFPGSSDRIRFNTYAANFGLMKNLEVGACVVDPEQGNAKVLVNAKYLLFKEKWDRPSVAVGVVDAGSQLHKISNAKDDPGAYIVIGKNITQLAQDFTAKVVKPVHGYIGYGTGLYDGFFAGLNFALTNKLSILGEYVENGIKNSSTFSAALRYSIAPSFNLEAGLYDFEDVNLGVSYKAIKF